MQRVERRQPESIGTLEQMKELAHQLRSPARRRFSFARQEATSVRSAGSVGTLLEGSVRKAENRLRVTVQLIEVRSGYHRLSQRFDRTLEAR